MYENQSAYQHPFNVSAHTQCTTIEVTLLPLCLCFVWQTIWDMHMSILERPMIFIWLFRLQYINLSILSAHSCFSSTSMYRKWYNILDSHVLCCAMPNNAVVYFAVWKFLQYTSASRVFQRFSVRWMALSCLSLLWYQTIAGSTKQMTYLRFLHYKF